MYWQTDTYIEDNIIWNTYNFFEFKKIENSGDLYYNGWSKEIVYPQKFELVISSRDATSIQEFIDWYERNVYL